MPSPNTNPDPQEEAVVSCAPRSGPGDGSAQKRPAWDSSNDRASKRRASKACLSCRNRKVRCDVVSGGHPCTNCRLDKLDCVVRESHRGRRPNTAASARPVSESPPPAEPASPTPPRSDPPRTRDTPPADNPPGNRPSDYLVSLTFEGQQECSPPQQVADEIHVDTSRSLGENHSNPSPPRNPAPPYRWAAQPSISHAQPKPDGTTRPLPPYIRPLPRHIKLRDLQYLADKGALTIPDEAFRNELLRTYAYMVYPFMPAMDYEAFLHSIVMADDRDPVSLLLFQAVMFASVTFVDGKLLRERGYTSRKAARKEMFGRVQLLYGLDCEPDRLSLLQAVLLMTYWYDSQADDKDTWYWMGIALGRAQVLGLHREPDSATPPRARQLKRRIWWSCVVRDRLLALGIRRPSRIRNDDFDVAPLTVDDFDVQTPSDTVSKILGHSKITASVPASRVELGTVSIELTKLCLCLGHILHSQYSLMGDHAAGPKHLPKAIVIPQQSSTQRQEMAKCDAELDKWVKNQDPRSKYAPTGPEPEDMTDEALRIIRLHQALLQMVYLTSLSILHKPLAFQPGSDGADGALKKASREKVTRAAVATTKLAFQLQANNQLRYLSTSSIPAFLSASLVHLMDIRSADEEVRNISIGRFYQCVQALQELQDMYGSADCAIQFIEGVLRKTDINVPMMKHCLFPPGGIGIGQPAGRISDSAPDRMGTGTPYPSPPSSWNRLANMEAPGVYNEDTFEADLALPVSPFDVRLVEAWADGNGQFGNNQERGETVADPSMMGGWVDVDNLVPAPMNFDPDSNLSLANHVGFM